MMSMKKEDFGYSESVVDPVKFKEFRDSEGMGRDRNVMCSWRRYNANEKRDSRTTGL